ncbi:glycosyl transferase [Williamsia phyllosphaerae]|uniref:Glycosyl transferase n=1 Tax=Williamsia phyllosphaerae TaxID=885042 RepID=A0ABQ1V1G1_9NOCA|nr:glycosyl transferase [Williamsia phyllosphaerae]
MSTTLLSVVIPTYDEEDVIADCLDRLLPQLEHIHEILVVDNNSQDKTVDIVATYVDRYPAVRMISEERQGLVFARNAGLDAATGTAIARIDSDTMVGPRWAADIVEFLDADTDGHWAALCGRGEAYGLPYGDAMSRLKERIAFLPFAARRHDRQVEVKPVFVLYGSNMVLRRDTWLAIRESVSMRRDIFEDVDTGLCVGEIGGRNAFLPHLGVGVSPRRMESSVGSFIRYMSFLPRTFLLHKRYGLAVGSMTLYVPWVTLVHAARLILIRSYDAQTRTFAPRHLLRRTTDRIMP